MKSVLSIRSLMLLLLVTAGLASPAPAQSLSDYPALPSTRYRSGQAVLNAFKPISALTSNSIVELNVDEDTVALGMVVDADGLVLTKASEIKPGKLTCWLANGKEVEANVLASDKEDDVALVRVKAEGLKPIQWATNRILEGQWAITPGLADTPQAVGIISTLTHRIDSQRRALMGIQWNTNSPDDSPLIVDTLAPGFGAEKAGIQPGDLIVAVDGAPVTNRAEVVEILKGFHDGQLVRVRYKRADKEFDVRVELTTPRPGQMGYEEFLAFRLSRLSGDVSERSEGFNQAIEHDTVLEPWQCGGPLVNLDGKVIGLNIARANRVATYALPAPLVRQILAKLKSKALNPQTDN